MSKDETEELIAKLNEALSREKITIFDDKEVKKIREMIAFFETWSAAGRIGVWARNFLLFVGSIVLIWVTAQAWIIDFIKGALK